MKGSLIIGLGGLILLVGLFWAAQGAGVAGSGSFMDNNPAFINIGSYVAVGGILVIVLGVVMGRRGNPQKPN